jgi:hypothetical protein
MVEKEYQDNKPPEDDDDDDEEDEWVQRGTQQCVANQTQPSEINLSPTS